MLVALIVWTPNVAEVPLSVKVRRVFGVLSASLMVKTPFTPVVAKVTTGAALERVSGAALERVNALSLVAPRVVTDSSVSASVPVTVISPVPELIETVLMPPPTIVRSPCKVFNELTKLPVEVVKQVGQEIVPLVLLKLIGPVAATAMVPLWFGTVRVLVVPVVSPERSNCVFFVLSALLMSVVELSTSDLLVKVWVWLRNANVSFALSAGIVATLDEVGATVVIVVVLVVPKTNWLVVLVKFKAAKVGELLVPIDCGKVNVNVPVAAVVLPFTKTWLAVPATERTPELAIEIVPAPLVIAMPLPWVKVLSE